MVKRYAEHLTETTVAGEDGREFRDSGSLTFTSKSCFVLTNAGLVFVESGGLVDDGARNCVPDLPHWDKNARRLRFDDVVVKRFKWPAANQEAILCAFQEEGWPERIDDPLPPQDEQDPKRRLADTIKTLNRKQENHLIHFRGDGTGEGVIWERRTSKEIQRNGTAKLP